MIFEIVRQHPGISAVALALVFSWIIFRAICKLEENKSIRTGRGVLKEVREAKENGTTGAKLIGGMEQLLAESKTSGRGKPIGRISETIVYFNELLLDMRCLQLMLFKAKMGQLSLKKMGTDEDEVIALIRWIEKDIFSETDEMTA